MLEWVCPQCDRSVSPAFLTCPHCAGREAVARPVAVGKQRSSGETADRYFRVFLGVVAVLALIYFLVVLEAFNQGHDALLYRLVRWFPHL